MKTISVLAIAALLVASAGLASAQTTPSPAPSVTAPKAADVQPVPTAVPRKAKNAKVAKSERTRTPESLACSAEADLQALKGDPRKAFRKKCMADAKKAAAATSPAGTPASAPKN